MKAEFLLAGFASAKPHRDDEDIAEVSGYRIVPHHKYFDEDAQQQEAEWLRTGICPDPSFYFSTDSRWLDDERRSWAWRRRTRHGPEDAVHFLLDGRDGYVEILAAGFTWKAWPQGSPRLSEVSGEPVMTGRWTDGTDR